MSTQPDPRKKGFKRKGESEAPEGKIWESHSDVEKVNPSWEKEKGGSGRRGERGAPTSTRLSGH